jgi:hypothetical protein
MIGFTPNQEDVKLIIAKRIREHVSKWNWIALSKNKAITLDMITYTADLSWNQKYVTLNPNSSLKYIVEHIEDHNWTTNGWYWDYISSQYATMDIVKLHPHLPWNYKALSQNPCITIVDVLENIKIPWDWRFLSCHPNMTWDIIQAHRELPWHTKLLSANPNITWDIIKSNPEIDWDFDNFTRNPNLTAEIITNNPMKHQYYKRKLYSISTIITSCKNTPHNDKNAWNKMSSNPNLTWGVVENNLDKPWNYSRLSSRQIITFDIVKNNPDVPWNYLYLSMNPNITWDIVTQNRDKPWNYSYLSMNPNITWGIVKHNRDKPWNYSYLSMNPNITWDIVKNNPDINWKWSFLSGNPSIFKLLDQEVDYLSKITRIQKMWRYVLCNPNYAICRKRMLREFQDLGTI